MSTFTMMKRMTGKPKKDDPTKESSGKKGLFKRWGRRSSKEAAVATCVDGLDGAEDGEAHQ